MTVRVRKFISETLGKGGAIRLGVRGSEEVARLLLTARSREEIQEAWRVQQAWLERHPDDRLVREAAEQLKVLASRWY